MFDVVVIGSGPGGYVAAIKGAQLGGKVALVEGHKIGGCCLNVGCIPTKALVHAAHTYINAQHSERFGVKQQGVELDLTGVMAHKERTVNQLVGGVDMLLKGTGSPSTEVGPKCRLRAKWKLPCQTVQRDL